MHLLNALLERQMHRPMLRALKLVTVIVALILNCQMHRPMLRALKLHTLQRGETRLKSDASPDVEGIETPIPEHVIPLQTWSDASPDVEGIETCACNRTR